MSVEVMSAVFKRYPNGGGEMLLALALADHANDEGASIHPGITLLAEKTRQSERTVQYQLRNMEAAGWLIRVGHGNGGRSKSTEYRISPEWLMGAEIAPIKKGAIHDIKGAIYNTKGCNPRQERVQPVAPASNHHKTIIEPSKNHTRARELAQKTSIDRPDDVDEQTWNDWMSLRKTRRAPATATALAGIRREASKAGLTLSDALAYCCERGWQGFNASWYTEKHPAKNGAQPLSQSGSQTLINAASLKQRIFNNEMSHA